jgi:hypothetical protein
MSVNMAMLMLLQKRFSTVLHARGMHVMYTARKILSDYLFKNVESVFFKATVLRYAEHFTQRAYTYTANAEAPSGDSVSRAAASISIRAAVESSCAAVSDDVCYSDSTTALQVATGTTTVPVIVVHHIGSVGVSNSDKYEIEIHRIDRMTFFCFLMNSLVTAMLRVGQQLSAPARRPMVPLRC